MSGYDRGNDAIFQRSQAVERAKKIFQLAGRKIDDATIAEIGDSAQRICDLLDRMSDCHNGGPHVGAIFDTMMWLILFEPLRQLFWEKETP